MRLTQLTLCLCVSTDSNVLNVLYLHDSMLILDLCLTFLQLIPAYSAPPAPPEAADFSYESASTRLDFKDSDMKRLSMEIERERWAGV